MSGRIDGSSNIYAKKHRHARLHVLFLPNFQSAQKIFGGEIKNHLLYFISKGADDFQAKIDDYKVAAEEFKGKVSKKKFV